MVVHNADGSLAEMCGNGLRCVAKYLLDREPGREAVEVETGAGVLPARGRRERGEVVEVEIELGPARLQAPHLPPGQGGGPFVAAPVPGVDWPGTAVSMGNPHLVLLGAPAQVVREHGFATNRGARGLSSGRTGMIGLTLPLVNDAYFGPMLSGATEALYESDLRIVLCPTLHEHDREVSLMERGRQVGRVRGTSRIDFRNRSSPGDR